MANKLLGYILSGVGLLVILSSFSSIKAFFSKYISVLSSVNNIYLYILGGALVVFGVFFLIGKGSTKQAAEVPIYQGRNVVGYRRR